MSAEEHGEDSAPVFTLDEIKAMPLVEKIWHMQQEIGHVQKTGWNERMRYNYLIEADMVRAVLAVAKKYRVLVTFRQVPDKTEAVGLKSKAGEAMTGTYATLAYDVINVDKQTERLSVLLAPDHREGFINNPFPVPLESQGYSADSGDKSLFKARTGAKKYALMETFLSISGDDPELAGASDDSNRRRNPKQPQQTQPRPEPRQPRERPPGRGAEASTKALPQQINQWWEVREKRGIPHAQAYASIRKAVPKLTFPDNITEYELRKMMAELDLREMNQALSALQSSGT